MRHVHALIAEYDRLEAELRDVHTGAPPTLHTPSNIEVSTTSLAWSIPPLPGETCPALDDAKFRIPVDGIADAKPKHVQIADDNGTDLAEVRQISKESSAEEVGIMTLPSPREEPPSIFLGHTSHQDKKARRQTRRVHDQENISLAKPWSGSKTKQKSSDDQNWLTFIVLHERFDMAMTALIAANTCALAFEVQYQGLGLCHNLDYKGCEVPETQVWPNATDVFLVFDWIFGIGFIVEGSMKVWGLRFGFFKAPANWVDMGVIIAFLIEKVAANLLPFDAPLMRLCRLLRLARLSRIIRSLEKLDQLYVMVTSLEGMAKTFLWALVLLTVILVTCALFLTQTLQATYFDQASAEKFTPEELEIRHQLYEYFGTFTRCVLSMYEITLGNWPPVARLLTEHVTEWFTVVCVVHKMLVGFAVIGVLNGVVLQETFKVAQTDDTIMVRQKRKLVQIGREKMKVLLTTLDTSGDGDLEFMEFMKIKEDPEIMTWLSSMDIEVDDLPSLFRLIDLDGSGQINMEELALRIPRIKGTARSLDALLMKEMMFDFKQIMEDHGHQLARLTLLAEEDNHRSPVSSANGDLAYSSWKLR